MMDGGALVFEVYLTDTIGSIFKEYWNNNVFFVIEVAVEVCF